MPAITKVASATNAEEVGVITTGLEVRTGESEAMVELNLNETNV